MIYILVIFAPMSCTHQKVTDETEIEPPPPPDPPEPEQYCRLSVTLAETQFEQNINTGQVGLFTEDLEAQPMQTNVPVTLVSGYKEVKMDEGSDSLGSCFVYYPYSTSVNANKIYSATIPQIQSQTITSSTSLTDVPADIYNSLLMISTRDDVVNFKRGQAEVSLRNVFSLLRFEIKISPELAANQNFNTQRIKSMEMYISSSTDTISSLLNLAGDYTIDLTKTPGEAGYVGPTFTRNSFKIIGDISQTTSVLNSTTPAVIWMVIPPQPNFQSDYKFVLKLVTEDDNGNSYNVFKTATIAQAPIERNSLIAIPMTVTIQNIVTDSNIKKDFAGEIANTYNITEAGLYSIPAKKITGTNINGGVEAKWLWANKKGSDNTFDISDLVLENSIYYNSATNSVLFRVGNALGQMSEGNVIIALKDAVDNILWTWHIWITKPENKPQEIVFEGERQGFLDRNIGAMTAEYVYPHTDSYGFLYQWGRKDPFPAGNGQIDETTAFASVNNIKINTGLWNFANQWSRESNVMSGFVNFSITHPMKFFYNTNTTVTVTQCADWLMESDPSLWSDAQKTDYDPCPYGYRVPDTTDIKKLYDAHFNISDISQNFSRLSANHWEYVWNASPARKAVFPSVGYRNGVASDGGKYVVTGHTASDRILAYWTRTPAKAGSTPVSGGSYRLFSPNNTLLPIDYNVVPYFDYDNNADAYPIRCVRRIIP